MSRFFAPGCDRSRIDAGAAAMEFAAAPVRRRKDRIAVADGRKRRRQIGQRVGDELHKLPFPLNAPIDGQHVRGKDDAALLFTRLAMRVSSSMVMTMTPLAEPFHFPPKMLLTSLELPRLP